MTDAKSNGDDKAMTTTPRSTSMEIARAEQFKFALEPSSFQETLTACELLANAGIKGCESPPQVLAKVMAGRSLGIGFMASVMGIDNIEGSMALRAKLKLALCLKAGHICEYFRCTESTHEKATWVCKRIGEPEQSRTFTIEDAAKAGLLDRGKDQAAKEKSNWNRWTASMLRARASSQLADIVFPDVTGGMAATEDLRDGDDPDEMIGEVVHPIAGAPKRDWAAEQKTLIAKIDTITEATDPRARKPIREEVQAFLGEAPEPYRAFVGNAFNASPKYAAPKGGMVPPAAGQQSLAGPASGATGGTEA